ncbi:hypothetical protein TOPH_06263 [Tolypocladium ophioglossoides CBS 100239]|uniref:Uncharacterized protein n=1 Tax=Tolypocladium ophioglossoides (strain CBS 100239) TaxID=1163406 RepID=A0A0L0N4W4_TOLOC|nr:hypothetical protein TOPH_06263 [Tolypocladium ophioglossoides CBS 100239]
MQPLATLFVVATLWAAYVMALSPRDAIHTEDLDRYDTFMAKLTDTQFLDMQLQNGAVKIDVYQHPSNDLAGSEKFTPSASATKYFEQEVLRAEEAPAPPNDSKLHEEYNSCLAAAYGAAETHVPGQAEKRRSNCYQFCGSIAHCRGNNGCPHCYAVRQGCLWQKWCR